MTGKDSDIAWARLLLGQVPIVLVTVVGLCWVSGNAGAASVSAKQALLWGVTRAHQLHVQAGMHPL